MTDRSHIWVAEGYRDGVKCFEVFRQALDAQECAIEQRSLGWKIEVWEM